MKILVLGSGAREHAILKALHASPKPKQLFCLGSHMNPGIISIADLTVGAFTEPQPVVLHARAVAADIVIVGPEAPLEHGVADALWKAGIACFGPTKVLAQLETSKTFTRELLTKHHIHVGPRYASFSTMTGVAAMLHELGEQYVIKVDGLMGGKGVRVAGDHFQSRHEAYAWCEELVAAGKPFLIEEKLEGQEFSFISISDGRSIAHTIPIQDHKRAYDGDVGPNTGGMGTYSGPHGTLPFLSPHHLTEAKNINERVWRAVQQECDEAYIGVLYGGFMATKDGVKLIEYNARFGDPEAMNIFALLKTDAVSLFEAIKTQTLEDCQLAFASSASVCIYKVPEGYPTNPKKGEPFTVPSQDSYYFGAATAQDGKLVMTGSRTIAAVGTGATIEAARQAALQDMEPIVGPLFCRTDIASAEMIDYKIAHMKSLT